MLDGKIHLDAKGLGEAINEGNEAFSQAEQNNELLMKNHESHPTGSTPFSEANVTSYNRKDKGYTRSCGRGHGHGRGRGRS
ncbi:hypothetical protein PVK06_026718 [Gossypium arboreum]|uniref:Uncharacterized protein n=1 Tax=Gossypium arboreum TaxID=29729 RepID=A0ABR0NYI2_GOSAR|nr:hypothetical protein PVK06_026718 [Gossypium arboreum]